MNLRKYLVLLSVMIFGGTGDVLLKRGMQDFGPVDPHHLLHVISALRNPWVLAGIALLVCFFAAYLTALSWADLSYVLPATAMGYLLVAVLSHFFLHETVSPYRWAGIILISCGVGWVTRGPEITERRTAEPRTVEPTVLREAKEQHEIA